MSPKSRRRKPKKAVRPKRVSTRSEPVAEYAGRYTPPSLRKIRFRPTWHKLVGGVLIVAGVALFIACEASFANIHAFGGHIWYAVGLGVAASSMWWFGAFDAPT